MSNYSIPMQKYFIMPFGLTNTPAMFQTVVIDTLGECKTMLNRYIFVQLDVILILSCSLEDHVHHIQTTQLHLRKHYLSVKAANWGFHTSSVILLGYNVSQDSMQMDHEKVSAVTTWPVPEGGEQLQLFQSFTNFYQRLQQNCQTSQYTDIIQGAIPIVSSYRGSLQRAKDQIYLSSHPSGSRRWSLVNG